jgi:hypothetical protein
MIGNRRGVSRILDLKAEGRRFDPGPGHHLDQYVSAGQGHIEIQFSRVSVAWLTVGDRQYPLRSARRVHEHLYLVSRAAFVGTADF